MKQPQASIDLLTPKRGLIDLADHSKGDGPLLIGYELDEVFDDFLWVLF